jgi:N-carbamoylputrescine amidase
VHQKYYLPNESGYWEAVWYQRGDGDFSLGEANGIRTGFLICTEMWFSAHARQYAKDGIHLLLCPRATPGTTADKWVAGGRAAAVVSGAYCLSSNFSGECRSYPWAGTGWIIEPQEGTVLGTTSKENPFLTLDIDLQEAETAKSTFPRYVPD